VSETLPETLPETLADLIFQLQQARSNLVAQHKAVKENLEKTGQNGSLENLLNATIRVKNLKAKIKEAQAGQR